MEETVIHQLPSNMVLHLLASYPHQWSCVRGIPIVGHSP